MSENKDELKAYLAKLHIIRAEIARALASDEKAVVFSEDVGTIEKTEYGYCFNPSAQLMRLIKLAEQYPENILPHSFITRKLWGMDAVGEGVLRLNHDYDLLVFDYYEIKDGRLYHIDGKQVNDERCDDTIFEIASDAPWSFNPEEARICPMVCRTNPWLFRNNVMETKEDQEFLTEVLYNTPELEKTIKEVMEHLAQEIRQEDNDPGPYFIKKTECLVDEKKRLIRFQTIVLLTDRAFFKEET